MTAKPIVAVDTETTGRTPGLCMPWEIAFIRRDRAGVERETRFCVDISESHPDPDPEALAIGRYWERHPAGIAERAGSGIRPNGRDYVTPAQAARRVHKWTSGAVLVGCTVSFDAAVFAWLLHDHGNLEPKWDYHILDATTYAAGYLRGRAQSLPAHAAELVDPGPPPYKSNRIAERLGITQPAEEAHTALGDARRALRMFLAVSP